MAVKNIAFRENWVGSKVADIKATFLAIFEPIWTSNLAVAVPNKFLKQHFS